MQTINHLSTGITKLKNLNLLRLASGVVCAGAVLLMSSSAWAQDLFVSDFINGNIYRITPKGEISVFASGMDYPYGIAFNHAGDLFVANSALDAGTEGYIGKINPDGTPHTFYANLDPKAVAVNSAGHVFEADYHSGIIYEYTPDGRQSTFATGFWAPLSLAFNRAGHLFVGDGYGNGNGRVSEIMPNGTIKWIASGLSYPSIAFDRADNLFVSNQGNGYIYKYTHNGEQHLFATVGGANGGNNGLAFDRAGNLFVETPSGPIIEITPSGEQRTFATVPGNPAGLAFEPARNFWVHLRLEQRHF
jgi:sugar lactone lactonase YvrE